MQTALTRLANVCSMGLPWLRTFWSMVWMFQMLLQKHHHLNKVSTYIRIEHHKKNPPLAPGMVIPIISAMQGHPESPRLWEKHADAILCNVGLTLTVHELWLYLSIIWGQACYLQTTSQWLCHSCTRWAYGKHSFQYDWWWTSNPHEALGVLGYAQWHWCEANKELHQNILQVLHREDMQQILKLVDAKLHWH